MSRLELEMSINDALFAMSEGNPGAIRVMMDGLQAVPTIDPENLMGGWSFILNLDMLGIYGRRIWRLFKDLCGEDINSTVALVRSVQVGAISRETLDLAIDGTGTLDIPAALKELKKRISSFQI